MVLLLPVSLLYFIGHKIHHAVVKTHESPIPVVCVGNLTAGGSGKTPVALALMDLIERHSMAQAPSFLSRGYGGSETGPLHVDIEKHNYKQVGDEPLLLARTATTIISRNRKDGALYAARTHDLLVMDDGLQNPTLTKTLSFVVIDGNTGFGNGQMIPSGPLRQSLNKGFKSADAFIIIGEDKMGSRSKLPKDKPIFEAHLRVPENWISNSEQHYVAFTGLGHPQKFYNSLKERNLSVKGEHSFPDHHPYTETDLEHLDELAQEKEARLITTEKDAVKIPEHMKLKSTLDIMPIAIEWEDKEKVKDFLNQHIKINN